MTESTELTDQASTAELSRYAIHYQPLFQPLQAMEYSGSSIRSKLRG
jgi:hypothetical protein